MGFWSWLTGSSAAGVTPNATAGDPPSVGPDYNPGDPHGAVVLPNTQTMSRQLPQVVPSPWSGWPSGWGMPDWQTGISRLVDTAWDCIDLNASVLSTMPVYRLARGQVAEPIVWMQNPSPDLYTGWSEFAKQVFWDFQMGEVFIVATEFFATGYPAQMMVVPGWAWRVDVGRNGVRRYFLGGREFDPRPNLFEGRATGEVLHIRYKSSIDQPHGVGPLAAAGARLTTAGVLQRQIDEVAASGGVPPYIINVKRKLNKAQSDELTQEWLDSRAKAPGAPAIVSGVGDSSTVQEMKQPSTKDLALLELSQFTESRIAVKLGVPPFLMGLPSGGDSMTYSNVSQLFDFHDRASLKTKATHVMEAISNWALPRGQTVELNRDEYSRPDFATRASAWVALKEADIVTAPEVRAAERLHGDNAASAITGDDSV